MFNGSINIDSEFIHKLRVNFRHLYDLLHDNCKFHWDIELDTLPQQKKSSIKKTYTLTLPNKNHAFFITLNFSLDWYKRCLSSKEQ